IYGYADYLGTQSPNKILSQQRATATKDFLLSIGVTPHDIKICTGVGQINTKNDEEHGNLQYRKSEIYFLKQPPQAPEPKPLKKEEPQVPIAKDITKEALLEEKISTANVNDVIALNNLLFFNNATIMKPESYGDLNQLLLIMQQNTNLKIKIEGHICCNTEMGMIKGTREFQLSENRAKVVYLYLATNGIDTNRLSFEGFGRTRPLFPLEETEKEQYANRRVEIRILSK